MLATQIGGMDCNRQSKNMKGCWSPFHRSVTSLRCFQKSESLNGPTASFEVSNWHDCRGRPTALLVLTLALRSSLGLAELLVFGWLVWVCFADFLRRFFFRLRLARTPDANRRDFFQYRKLQPPLDRVYALEDYAHPVAHGVTPPRIVPHDLPRILAVGIVISQKTCDRRQALDK